MSNIKVSSDIDELLRKSTKTEVNAFLGVNGIRNNTDTNTADIATNTADIATNTADIATKTADIATANTNIATNAAGINTNIAAVSALSTRVDGHESNLNSLNDGQSINDNGIAANTALINANTAAIATKASNSTVAYYTGQVANNTNSTLANYNSIVDLNDELNYFGTQISYKAPLIGPAFTGSSSFGGDVQFNDNAVFNSNATFSGSDFQILSDTDTSIGGSLSVGGDAEFTQMLTLEQGAEIVGGVTIAGNLDVSQVIDCPEISATTGTIGDATIGSDLTFQHNNSNSVKINNSGLTLSQQSTSLVKEDCYFKSGAVRLQRASSADDEILMRYNGQNSDDFLIQQFSGGNEKGHIKFLGNTSQGSRVRLEADQIDVGFNRSGFETNLVKIYSDTNIGANKKLVFKDSRTSNEGLIFEHSGTNAPTIQMGMYGSSGSSDFGKFKLTHTDSFSTTSDVICVEKDNNYVRMESPRTEMNDAQIDGTLSASNGNFQTDTFGNLYNVSNIVSDGEIQSVSLSTSDVIECSGQATFEDDVEIQGSLDCGSLTVSGNVSWNGDVTIDGYTKTGSFDGSTNYPSSPSAGMIIFDNSTGVNKFYGYDGTSWNQLG